MIVEFTGLPGSGKSTLNAAVEQFLLSGGYTVWTPRKHWKAMGLRQPTSSAQRGLAVTRKTALLIMTGLANIRLISMVPWFDVLAGRPLRHQKMVLNSFMSNLAELEVAKRLRGKSTVALLDEGIVHRAYGLFVSPEKPINSKTVERYARTVNLPDILVYVQLNRFISLKRMLRRGVPLRMTELENSKVLRMLAHGEVLLDVLVKAIHNRTASTCRIVELDGAVMDTARKELLNWLDNHLRNSKSDPG